MAQLAAALVLTLAAACTKSESGPPAPEASTTPAPPAEPAASAAAAGGAAPGAGAEPVESARVAAKDAADASRADAPPTSDAAAADAGVGCGTKPLPDCPLQAWMKTHANPPVMTNDLPGLATVLDKTAAFAPPGAGYESWASISKDGAAAARSGDLAAAKAACRSCHDQYKQKYKTELRPRKI